mmetsp:Transcript_23138/g.39324  ORF Transcript_23138/g.39324 Transcript_23138/m.39324 type:complete len:286 (-) Transcript_23138:41-898(-)
MFSFCCLILFSISLVNAKYDWSPISPSSFPKTIATDKIDVTYVEAPLLKAEVGPVFGYLGLYHGGLKFHNHRTNFTFTTNYDSVDLNLFQSQLPQVIEKNGQKELKWFNAGRVYCYKGGQEGFWTPTTPMGTINGTQFNSYLPFLIGFNQTWPYYEMFNIGTTHKVFVDSRECFDFAIHSLKFLENLGAVFTHKTVRRNEAFVLTDHAPVVVNYTDPAVKAKVIEFYEVLTLKWKKAGNFFELIEELWDIARGKEFYHHAGSTYYKVKVKFPVFDVRYKPVPALF